MKIAVFTNNYLPNPYGVAGSVESFRKELERRGHEVFVFAPCWKGYKDENPNVFRYPSVETNIKIKFPIAVPYSRKMSEILENLDLDIIHSQHPNLLGSAARRWARRKNIPLVFTWHTLYDKYAHFAPFVPRQFAVWWAIRNARNYANRCDAVVVPTESIIGIIRDWGVTNENINAIPTGVEEKDFQNSDHAKIRKELGVSEKEILLVVLTRLTEEKNIEFLFKSVLPVLKEKENVKFLVCGEGSLEQKLRDMVSEEEMNGRIIFTGLIPNDIKEDYYAAGDVFVWASKSETQGMILTEAMYVGLPIVAVRATGAQDIVEEGRTGFLVSESKEEFGAAVQKLIADENSRKAFGEAAKLVAREKYTSAACAKKMLEVYEKAIRDKKSSS